MDASLVEVLRQLRDEVAALRTEVSEVRQDVAQLQDQMRHRDGGSSGVMGGSDAGTDTTGLRDSSCRDSDGNRDTASRSDAGSDARPNGAASEGPSMPMPPLLEETEADGGADRWSTLGTYRSTATATGRAGTATADSRSMWSVMSNKPSVLSERGNQHGTPEGPPSVAMRLASLATARESSGSLANASHVAQHPIGSGSSATAPHPSSRLHDGSVSEGFLTAASHRVALRAGESLSMRTARGSDSSPVDSGSPRVHTTLRDIPIDVLHKHICPLLDPQDLGRLNQVCSKLRYLVMSEELWERRCLLEGWHLPHDWQEYQVASSTPWHDLFRTGWIARRKLRQASQRMAAWLAKHPDERALPRAASAAMISTAEQEGLKFKLPVEVAEMYRLHDGFPYQRPWSLLPVNDLAEHRAAWQEHKFIDAGLLPVVTACDDGVACYCVRIAPSSDNPAQAYGEVIRKFGPSAKDEESVGSFADFILAFVDAVESGAVTEIQHDFMQFLDMGEFMQQMGDAFQITEEDLGDLGDFGLLG